MIAKCSRRSTPFTVATLLDGSQHAERNSVEPTLQIRLRRAHPIADALQQPDSRGPTELERAITDAGPFGSIGEAQAAVDGWREEYNHRRPRADGERTRRAILRTAAAFPDRIGAGATFHGGGLVTDKPDSPHLLIPKIKAHYLMAIAENDDQQQPDAKTVLREAFAKAHLPAEIEVYAGTMHGWCPPDSHVYNHDQAEKAWARQLALFKKALA